MNSFDNIDREYAYDGELGAVWSPEATRFAVWSPETESVELRLYHDDSETEPFRTEEMHSENGVWKAAWCNTHIRSPVMETPLKLSTYTREAQV